jgi:hypothetical protein
MAEDAVWTKDEVVTEATRLRDLFRKMFTDRGSFNAVSYLYASRHPETGVYGKGLILVPSIGSFNQRERDVYANMLRVLGRKVSASGIIFASESWGVDPEYLNTLGSEEAILADYRKYNDLEEHPHRVEHLHMTLEHHRLTGTLAWFARITRDAAGKPSLGEWDEQVWTGRREGRFVNVLPPLN